MSTSLDPQDLYFAELEQLAPPTAEEERALLEQIKAGDRAAYEHFVAANQRLVVSIADGFKGNGTPLLDLIQAGNEGLLKAIDKFDLDRQLKFSTYATWWIREAVQRQLQNTSRTIRLPVHVQNTLVEYRRLQDALQLTGQPLPATDDVAALLDVSPEIAEVLVRIDRAPAPVSIDEPGHFERRLAELIPDDRADDPQELAVAAALSSELVTLMQATLTDRQFDVLWYRFGFDGQERYHRDVAELLGLSESAVREAYREGLTILRAALAEAAA